MKKLIIAEKPSLALNVRNSLHENFSNSDGYYESDNYVITFAFGHLFQLFSIKDYLNQDKPCWNLDILPYVPEQFDFKIKHIKVKVDEGCKKQYKIISDLIARNDIDEILHLGDADTEGEILIRLIIENAFKDKKITKTVRRIWSPEQTPNELYFQVHNAKPDSNYDNLANEGYTRTFMDWLLGINLTRLITIKSNSDRVLPVGRVLIPIVKAVYDRDMEIKNFIPESYYQLESNEITGKEKIHLPIGKKYSPLELTEAKEYAEKLNSYTAEVTSLETNEVTKKPSQLFSLSELQGYVSTKNKMSFNDIYKVVQNLYEKGFVTYPRTNSRYLGEDDKSRIEKIIDLFNESGYDLEMKNTKSIFDSSQIESHSAITPTSKIPTEADLSKSENEIYTFIKNRFISNFLSEKCLIDRTIMEIKVGNEIFKIKGDIIKQQGFLKYEPMKTKKDTVNLPNLKVGDIVNINFIPIDKLTKSPKKLTTKTLSDFLKNPFKSEKESLERNSL